MAMVLDVGSWILLIAGSFICVTGGVGMLRFPDFFTRIHAAGVTDTLGAGLIFGGLMLQAGLTLVLAKLVMILLFMLFTSPTASHAVAKAALHSGLKPQLDEVGDRPGAKPSNP